MQSSPAGFFILHRQVRILHLQQPLQKGLLPHWSCHVESGATKAISQGGCIVAVQGQEQTQLTFRTTGDCSHDLFSVLTWATFGGALWCCQIHPGPHSKLTVNPLPFCVTTFVWSPGTHERKATTIRKLLFKKRVRAKKDTLVPSARIVLVLRFHCTLATPKTYWGLLLATITTSSWTQNKVLVTHQVIRDDTKCLYTK